MHKYDNLVYKTVMDNTYLCIILCETFKIRKKKLEMHAYKSGNKDEWWWISRSPGWLASALDRETTGKCDKEKRCESFDEEECHESPEFLQARRDRART